jgi:bifunctional DNase/RNase
MAMTELAVVGLRDCPRVGGKAVILARAEGRQALHIILTPEEAHRIAHELQVESRDCPCFRNSIYSLVAFMVSCDEVGIDAIFLNPAADHRLAASVHVRTGHIWTLVPCHTADALALAIRLRVPILATEALARLLERERPDGATDPLPDEIEAAPWLDGVKPDDFAGRPQNSTGGPSGGKAV